MDAEIGVTGGMVVGLAITCFGLAIVLAAVSAAISAALSWTPPAEHSVRQAFKDYPNIRLDLPYQVPITPLHSPAADEVKRLLDGLNLQP
jgi:hypothetical protein